jgi:hypothetical protein
MVSLPVKASDPRTTSVFPSASTPAFAYNGAYQLKDTLFNGPGYWLRYAAAHQVPVTGDSILSDTIAVDPGWNLVGSITAPVAAPMVSSDPTGLVISRWFGYSSGYGVADTIIPGKGYWVKTSGAGSLFLARGFDKGSSLHASGDNLKSLNSLTITDAMGSAQTLYFGAGDGTIDPKSYSMPPLPPDGIFDARFTSDEMVALSAPGTRSSVGISIAGASYPVTLRALLHHGSASLVTEGGEVELTDGRTLTIAQPAAHLALRMNSVTDPSLPERYALLQNYPNPFNPSTEIRYQIPADAHVTLRVYDLLGRIVATLVDERKAPGGYSTRWDAGAMPSGIYYYTLSAGVFSQTRSMALIR